MGDVGEADGEVVDCAEGVLLGLERGWVLEGLDEEGDGAGGADDGLVGVEGAEAEEVCDDGFGDGWMGS